MEVCPKWLEEDISFPAGSHSGNAGPAEGFLALRENLESSVWHGADGNIHLSVAEKLFPLSPERAGALKRNPAKQSTGENRLQRSKASARSRQYLGLKLNDATLDLALGIRMRMPKEF